MSKPVMEDKFQKKAESLLVGRKIVTTYYAGPKDAKALGGWQSRPLVIQLDDDTILLPMRDDEGNDAGAILVLDKNSKETVLPVFPI